ncbi:MAG: CPXCG motif-containing cysteine-rich protein [Chloroflexi bacterium]|nr:CPXCG motif-containing cysteine-rich protein [Chloroflexota bacterium]
MLEEVEIVIRCPYCWSEITMLVDPTVRQQTYIEDCEVCCNPIQLTYRADGEEISSINVQATQ